MLPTDRPETGGSLFVTAAYALQPEGGGVQRCTREYLTLLHAAGFTPTTLSYPIDRALGTRFRRKLFPAPYRGLIPRDFAARCAAEARLRRVQWIFFNQTEAGALIPELARLRGEGIRFALLSHGLDSTDYLHEARTRAELRGGTQISRHDARWLGEQLFAEMRQHELCDAIFCLSDTDVALERWVGGRAVHHLPRLIDQQPLDWQPVRHRVGTVATLVHAPNHEGIVGFCRAAEVGGNPGFTLRLVGTPEAAGRSLAADFPFVDYLGGLDDAAFAAEARSWCAFVNPIFCYPRGCSTKLAVPLGWHLPVASTRAGARGYVWDEALIPLADSAIQLVAQVRALSGREPAAAARAAVTQLAAKSPRLPELAGRLRAALDQATRGAARL